MHLTQVTHDLIREFGLQIGDQLPQLVRVVAEAIKLEREACAKICDEEDTDCLMCDGTSVAARRIRARSVSLD